MKPRHKNQFKAVSLDAETWRALVIHRANTGKTAAATVRELVAKHIRTSPKTK